MTEPKITRRKITEYAPDSMNANRGTERGHRMLDDSVTEVGLGRSVVADKNGKLIGGNKTQQAAVDNGFEDAIEIETDGKTLVVVKRTDLDLNDPEPNNPARRMAYYDNRVSQINLDFDPAVLLSDMQTGVDLSKLWTPDELAELLAGMQQDEPAADPGAQVDRADELQKIWNVQRGDVWQISNHRLMCGDSTSAEDVARLMDGQCADASITDPPYGTASDSKVQKRGDRIETFDIEWDREAPLDWIPVLYDHAKEGAAVICFWENAGITNLWGAFKANGWNTLHTVYWKKTTVPQPRPNFCSSVESAVFARKPGKVLCWNGGGATPNVGEFNRAAGNERTPHETQKPVELFLWLMGLISDAGFIIFDPFCGSGTTLVACEQTGRRGYGMELSEAYTSVCLQRLKDMGLSPERVS